MNRRVNVLVIGAGAAGLAAARELSQAGFSAIVVEARERIGGRLWTVHDPDAPLPIELGAEFVHGQVPETFAIIHAARLMVDGLPDVHSRSRDGKLSPVRDFWGQVDEARKDIAKKLHRKRSGDVSVSEYLDRAKLPSDLPQDVYQFRRGLSCRVDRQDQCTLTCRRRRRDRRAIREQAISHCALL
jgi:monoamine oxidase